MKLRLRSLETKQTHKIETPDPCSLHHLKQLLFNSLNPHNPSSIENLHLSLNRRDELLSSSPNEEEYIQSFGIISGDLIFFTFNPSVFSSQNSQINLNPSTTSPIIPSSSQITLKSNSESDDTPPQGGKPTSDNTSNSLNTLESPHNLQTSNSLKEELVGKDKEAMDVEDIMDIDDVNHEGNVGKSFSVPGFLRKVFMEKLGDRSDSNHELSVIAIHAILLESGFIGFDPVSKMKVNDFQFQSNRLSLYYTLPEIITLATDSIEAVALKFNILSKYITVYASLINHKSVVHSFTFDEAKLAPFLNIVWANCGLADEFHLNDGVSSTSAEKQVFEFWRNVKDMLALPLLIDLCEKSGFSLPPCFTHLPTDLKLKILDFLPGENVAKVSCVSSELRYLASSDELWKKKYIEKFGDPGNSVEGEYWKQKFVNKCESLKMDKVFDRFSRHREYYAQPRMPRFIGGPHDMWPHGVIGGDFDRFPQPFGGTLPALGSGRHPFRRVTRSGNRNFF